MVLAYVGCSLPVSVFLYYGFLKSIPYEIIESSYIDECSEWKIYMKMILPLSTSAFGRLDEKKTMQLSKGMIWITFEVLRFRQIYCLLRGLFWL